uniref:Putative secreted protein n=1 Tax=Ixodes ricinus TaxID=34613 RepID=A0A6B0V380_IXORI
MLRIFSMTRFAIQLHFSSAFLAYRRIRGASLGAISKECLISSVSSLSTISIRLRKKHSLSRNSGVGPPVTLDRLLLCLHRSTRPSKRNRCRSVSRRPDPTFPREPSIRYSLQHWPMSRPSQPSTDFWSSLSLCRATARRSRLCIRRETSPGLLRGRVSEQVRVSWVRSLRSSPSACSSVSRSSSDGAICCRTLMASKYWKQWATGPQSSRGRTYFTASRKPCPAV